MQGSEAALPRKGHLRLSRNAAAATRFPLRLSRRPLASRVDTGESQRSAAKKTDAALTVLGDLRPIQLVLVGATSPHG